MPQVRERQNKSTKVNTEEVQESMLKVEQVEVRPRTVLPAKEDIQIGETRRRQVKKQLERHEEDARFQREREEMQRVHDLDGVDDDVEDESTLYAWRAIEHNHKPKTVAWYAGLAVGTTLVVGIQLFLLNIIGAVTIGLIGAAVYYIAQQKPDVARYRIMLDGIAINSLMYHWRDLAKFNVIYEPEDEVKTVIFLSKRQFSPFIHMEIGDANPLEIRDVLLEFLDEDQEMDEPIADVIARRVGF